MPNWFSRVFGDSRDDSAAATQDAPKEALPTQEVEEEDSEAVGVSPLAPRRVVEALVLTDSVSDAPAEGGVRIKAQPDPMNNMCTFMVDQPLFDGYSIVITSREQAEKLSPLAAALYETCESQPIPVLLESVLIHEANVAIALNYASSVTWSDFCKIIGAAIRTHVLSGAPCVSPDYADALPPEEKIREGLQKCIEAEINPGIAGHGGYITLDKVKGNTAYITMGGGCQGCAASAITLKQGIHSSFRSWVPEVGAILDETDHSKGANPFFTHLPAGMG